MQTNAQRKVNDNKESDEEKKDAFDYYVKEKRRSGRAPGES
jgi:hypothetical protein